jgi:hypothetical protein
MLYFPEEEQDLIRIETFGFKYDPTFLDLPKLIKKWQLVIDANSIGGIVTDVESLVTSMEMQVRFNKLTPDIKKHVTLHQYALPAIRRLYGELSSKITFADYNPKLIVNKLYDEMPKSQLTFACNIDEVIMDNIMNIVYDKLNDVTVAHGIFIHCSDTSIKVYS